MAHRWFDCWLAGQVMKGRGYGLVGNIIVGIVGAIVGGFLASMLFHMPDPVSGLNLTTMLIAALGAIVAIALVRALPGQSFGA